MNHKVKKVINFRFDRYKDIEVKLEKLAAKGLFLEECDAFLWTFRKGEPKKLKYTVTYFSEGSVFNPDITDNQQTYFDYAKAAGWDFVTQFNQMQIFCSEADNPIPFETDEKEKFENIKRCMRKSFLPSIIVMILVLMLNLVVQFNSFQLDPIDFLSDPSRLFSVAMILAVVIYEVYSLLDYFIWCKRSERSIAGGGECAENISMVRRIVHIIFMSFIFAGFGYLLNYLVFKISWFGAFLCIIQMPILLTVFWLSIKYLKKKKASAAINKVISFTVLILAAFAYLAFIVWFTIKFGFNVGADSDYRTVAWPVTATTSHEYRLYRDDIPLTCEDLYGDIDYDYYSYEKKINSTLFLTKSNYRQDSLPAKDAPPRLEYDILEPQFKFVYHLAKKHLLEIPQWRDNVSFESIDNKIFGTVEAYQRYYDDTPTGKYILLFENKMIELTMEEPPSRKQISIIKEKLRV
ncbi:DUF2812 domain-containing protein [Desulfosporosinus youngiae]|uniref:DUF2812 domain-containing protein n=1 Tax=Desulfosporosinus youngiae DSM 17734 TaxID=768710 RepID=H5Y3J9_9FIRM|nr:DUF2812 domain-containing protein [Desulfosporosinus youngiae]EHQ89108.1 Protein of unknown function (DUF2812) [Desulfosporosinus youngiae DSM 17734]